MKDKENQIEEMLEMARIIAFDLCPSGKQHNRLYREPLCYSNDNFGECSKIKNVVDNLYEQGYRKLPEDSVVLSREEYEKGIIERESMRNQITELFNDREQSRKETAEKIFQEINHLIMKDKTTPIWIKEKLVELAKQFGLEIKE